jgi:hypothetical protein
MYDDLTSIKISTGWIDLLIINEPVVKMSFRGYIPALPVRVVKTDLDYLMYISAKSIAEKLEPLRIANNGSFSGIRISIRKETSDKFSGYEIKALE